MLHIDQDGSELHCLPVSSSIRFPAGESEVTDLARLLALLERNIDGRFAPPACVAAVWAA